MFYDGNVQSRSLSKFLVSATLESKITITIGLSDYWA